MAIMPRSFLRTFFPDVAHGHHAQVFLAHLLSGCRELGDGSGRGGLG